MTSFLLGPSKALVRARLDHVAARDAALSRVLPIDKYPHDLLSLGDERDQSILAADASAITKGIEARQWTACDVLAVYVRAARRAQARLNCLTEVLFDAAVAKAQALDAYFEREGKLVGPLHGVPISIKDHIPTKGAKTTLGFSSWIANPPAKESATIVNVLEHLGAVPFVRTHIPQTMIAFECHTPVWGMTKNPINTGHTPGGSSGGESALLVAEGSVLGVGSDIGGSLRIPAAYAGCYSLKPSHGRWTRSGLAKYGGGLEGIVFVLGPMARSAADVELMFNSVVKVTQPPVVTADMSTDEVARQAAAYEALLRKLHYVEAPPIPLRPGWDEPLAYAKARGKPLRIGYLYTDGFIKTSPAAHRAVYESVQALKRKHGSEMELVRVPASLIRSSEALEIYLAILGSGGHYTKTDPIVRGREGLIKPIWLAIYLTRFPRFVLKLIALVSRYILRDAQSARVVRNAGMKSVRELEGWMSKKWDFVERFNDEVWDGLDLDGYIAPVHAVPALHHHGTADLSMIAAGTTIYNLMDNAVAVLPVTRVDADLDSHRPPTKKTAAVQQAWKRWSSDKELQTECSGVVNYNMYTRGRYDSARMHGLPMGVQIVCRPHAEEAALGLMRLLDDALPPPAERGGAWYVDGDRERPARGFASGAYTAAVYGQGLKAAA